MKKNLASIAGKNKTVAARATLWRLIENANRLDNKLNPEFCGHIQVARSEHGRVIRMCGIRHIADSWKPSKSDNDDDDADETSNIGLDTSSRFNSLGPVLQHGVVCAHCGKRYLPQPAVAVEGQCRFNQPHLRAMWDDR